MTQNAVKKSSCYIHKIMINYFGLSITVRRSNPIAEGRISWILTDNCVVPASADRAVRAAQ